MEQLRKNLLLENNLLWKPCKSLHRRGPPPLLITRAQLTWAMSRGALAQPRLRLSKQLSDIYILGHRDSY